MRLAGKDAKTTAKAEAGTTTACKKDWKQHQSCECDSADDIQGTICDGDTEGMVCEDDPKLGCELDIRIS